MRILFIADQFADAPRTAAVRHPGGAELTDAAAIAAAPYPVVTRRFASFETDELDQFDLILVGNSGTATHEQLRAIARTGRHVSFEHDLRICFWRGNHPTSPEPVHHFGRTCICPHRHLREFYDNALGVVYLTRLQREAFLANPMFADRNPVILGCSLFAEPFFERVARVDRFRMRTGTVVYGSRDRLKGFSDAFEYCMNNGYSPLIIRNMLPREVLEVFENASRFVYLPTAIEAAGRMPVEARFLGCEVICNDNVGVACEPWWRWPDEQALEYLRDSPNRFWREVISLL
jgi:hypothetical protein